MRCWHRPQRPAHGNQRRRHHHHRGFAAGSKEAREQFAVAHQMIARFKKSMRQFHVPPLASGPAVFGPRQPPLRDWTAAELSWAWRGTGVPTLLFPEVPQDVITAHRVYEMKPGLFADKHVRPEDVYIEDIREAMHAAALVSGVLKWKHLRVATVCDRELPTVLRYELSVPLTKEIIGATPTHYLAVYKPNDPFVTLDPLVRRRRRVDIFVVHADVLSLYCARLPPIPPRTIRLKPSNSHHISPDTFEPLEDSLCLRPIRLCLPHPPSLLLMLMYFYTGDPYLFSHQLLSAPGLAKYDADPMDPTCVQDVGAFLAEALDPIALQLRTAVINGLHANMVALRVDDRNMWALVECAWASVAWARYFHLKGVLPNIMTPPPSPPVELPEDFITEESREDGQVYWGTASMPSPSPWRWDGYYFMDSH